MVLGSKIEHDPKRRDFFWGIYLFWFGTGGNWWRPEFDAEVDYDTDKGHILHHVETLNESSLILFSIRRKRGSMEDISSPNEYFYSLFTAKTRDFKRFYETLPVLVDNKLTQSSWYCYPDVFKLGNKYHCLLCQDDYGNESKTIAGEIVFPIK